MTPSEERPAGAAPADHEASDLERLAAVQRQQQIMLVQIQNRVGCLYLAMIVGLIAAAIALVWRLAD